MSCLETSTQESYSAFLHPYYFSSTYLLPIMRFTTAALLAILSAATHAATNEPCYGPSGAAGVCISTAACAKAGGSTIAGACPADPAGVKCCSKPKCGAGGKGNCRWVSDCAGSTVANQCPGPSQMKCCSSAARGFGGYAVPKIPAVSTCKKVSVDGAKKIVAAFPGRVREIGCVRDCACPGSSDHCCGLATDMMISDHGGVSRLLLRLPAQTPNNSFRTPLFPARRLPSG